MAVKKGKPVSYFEAQQKGLDTLAHLKESRYQVLKKVSHSVQSMKTEVNREIEQVQQSRQQLFIPGVFLPEHWTPTVLQTRLFYKVVAAIHGKLLSVFDGKTEYQLGRTLRARRGAEGWPPLDACYYGYEDPGAAVAAEFPADSSLKSVAKVLIQIRASGRAYYHRDGRWALSTIKPVVVLADVTDGQLIISAQYLKYLADGQKKQ